MRSTIRISVIIPVFNAEKYLSECLDSVLEYKGENLEVILINDGSTDTSDLVCKKYSKKDHRIKYFDKSNSGVSATRNLGIKKANGDYVMFVDSDDILMSGWYKGVFGEAIYNDDFIIFSKRINRDIDKTEIVSEILGVRNRVSGLSSPCSKIYRREFLLENNIFFKKDIINGEDMLFNIEVVLRAKSTSVVNFDYYDYRQVLGSSTKRYEENFIVSDLAFHRELDSLLGDNGEYDFARRYSWQNAVVTIARRLSFVKQYKYAKKHFKELSVGPYKVVFLGKCILSGRSKIIFSLLRGRLYFMTYVLLKLSNHLKSNLSGGRIVRI